MLLEFPARLATLALRGPDAMHRIRLRPPNCTHHFCADPESAAMLTDYLRPGELAFYAEKIPGLLAARHKFMKEAGPRHTAAVEVRKRFWNFPADPQHDNLVPPLLVYADLMATGDARCIETAKMIYDVRVARLFTQA